MKIFVKFAFICLLALMETSAFSQTSQTPSTSSSKPEVKYVQVGDVKLAYYIRGQGEPLLMINGFISTMSLWDPALLDELSKKHQLILFDNRGVGLINRY